MDIRCLAFVCVVLLAVAGCSGEGVRWSATDEARAAIFEGQPDVARRSVFAVRRSGSSPDEDARAACTGVLVAPHLVMTARHCVVREPAELVICGHSRLDVLLPASSVSVSNDAVLSGDSRWYGARDLVVPEDGDDACGFDLALIVLAEPMAPELATPAEMRLTEPPTPGESLTAVGYGEAGDGETPVTRLARSELAVACVGSECGYGVGESEFVTTDGACRGDSGGPALDELERVVGILSRGSEPCATPIWTSVNAFHEFIAGAFQTTTDAELDHPAPGSPSCALSAARAPGSNLGLACFAWGLALIRRRRASTRRSRRAHAV